MTKHISRRVWLALLGTSAAMAVAAMPYQVSVRGVDPSAAFAKDDGGEGHGGSGGSDHGGGDRSGRGGGDDGGGDRSGRGGDDDGGGDRSGRGGGDDGDDDHDDNDHDDGEHVNAATGDRVEIDGSSIEVRHSDGTKEEIENGTYEMKDANGRSIVERPATAQDRARLEGFAG